MARPIALRVAQEYYPIPEIKNVPGIEVTPKPFWTKPKGLDYLNSPFRVDPEHAVECQNLYIDRGKLRSRKGTSEVGSSASDPVMGVLTFVTSGGVGFTIRFTTTKLQLLSGGVSWNDVPGATFTGDTTDYFTYTSFGDTLVFSNGRDGLWEYAPLVGTLTLIEEGPNAKHLTTFAGRVLASAPDGQDGRLQWSAKNNSRNWIPQEEVLDEDGNVITEADLAVGAGYEDLLSTPGGQVDSIMGVWPISDTTALMVRTGSVWTVTVTGDPDVPFRFERQFDNLGTRSRHAVDSLPGGIVMLGNDDVYIVADNDLRAIGQLVIDQMLLEASDLTIARGVYRSDLKEYWLTLGGTDVVYRYSFMDQGWTKHKYGFNIRWFDTAVFHHTGQTWDETLGTWDNPTDGLTVTWEDLIGDEVSPTFYFATTEAAGMVVEESAVETDDYLQSGHTQQGIEIQTPVLLAANSLDKSEIIEAQIEYEQGEVSQTMLIEYATDGGTVWSQYSSKALTSSAGTYQKLARAMKTLERETMQFRLRSSTLGRLTLHGFYLFLVQGARIKP